MGSIILQVQAVTDELDDRQFGNLIKSHEFHQKSILWPASESSPNNNTHKNPKISASGSNVYGLGHHTDDEGDDGGIGPLTVFKLGNDKIRGQAEKIRDRIHGPSQEFSADLVQASSAEKRDVVVKWLVLMFADIY